MVSLLHIFNLVSSNMWVEWLLFNVTQLYHGENKLIFTEMMISWFRANHSVLFLFNAACISKKQQIPFYSLCQPILSYILFYYLLRYGAILDTCIFFDTLCFIVFIWNLSYILFSLLEVIPIILQNWNILECYTYEYYLSVFDLFLQKLFHSNEMFPLTLTSCFRGFYIYLPFCINCFESPKCNVNECICVFWTNISNE